MVFDGVHVRFQKWSAHPVFEGTFGTRKPPGPIQSVLGKLERLLEVHSGGVILKPLEPLGHLNAQRRYFDVRRHRLCLWLERPLGVVWKGSKGFLDKFAFEICSARQRPRFEAFGASGYG